MTEPPIAIIAGGATAHSVTATAGRPRAGSDGLFTAGAASSTLFDSSGALPMKADDWPGGRSRVPAHDRIGRGAGPGDASGRTGRFVTCVTRSPTGWRVIHRCLTKLQWVLGNAHLSTILSKTADAASASSWDWLQDQPGQLLARAGGWAPAPVPTDGLIGEYSRSSGAWPPRPGPARGTSRWSLPGCYHRSAPIWALSSRYTYICRRRNQSTPAFSSLLW
jgi:hypothetical protein